jgi:hypothetical protein
VKKWVLGFGLLLAALLVVFLFTRRMSSGPSANTPGSPGAILQSSLEHADPAWSAAIDAAFASAQSAADAAVRQTVVTVPPGKPTEPLFTALPPATVMENVRRVFRDYAARFGGNPVGTNPEITRALDGDNPRQVHFLDEESGVRVNEKGELVDPWGVPFFLHQLSAKEMEIRSAGPDQRMWTDDDLVIR